MVYPLNEWLYVFLLGSTPLVPMPLVPMPLVPMPLVPTPLVPTPLVPTVVGVIPAVGAVSTGSAGLTGGAVPIGGADFVRDIVSVSGVVLMTDAGLTSTGAVFPPRCLGASKSQSLMRQCRSQRAGSFALSPCSLSTRIFAVFDPRNCDCSIHTSRTSMPFDCKSRRTSSAVVVSAR